MSEVSLLEEFGYQFGSFSLPTCQPQVTSLLSITTRDSHSFIHFCRNSSPCKWDHGKDVAKTELEAM